MTDMVALISLHDGIALINFDTGVTPATITTGDDLAAITIYSEAPAGPPGPGMINGDFDLGTFN